MAEIVARGAGMALSDVRRNRDGRTPELVHEPVTLMLGKLPSGTYEINGLMHDLVAAEMVDQT